MVVMQASRFLPLMFIASEPHTPSRHERRNDTLSSMRFLTWLSKSSTIVPAKPGATCSCCMRGGAPLSGS
jgi:hypothetical protein